MTLDYTLLDKELAKSSKSKKKFKRTTVDASAFLDKMGRVYGETTDQFFTGKSEFLEASDVLFDAVSLEESAIPMTALELLEKI